MSEKIELGKAKYNTYSFSSNQELKRILSDQISRFLKEYLPNPYNTAFSMSKGHCAMCNIKLYYYEGKTKIITGEQWDHIVPASQFGLFVNGNVSLLCAECNNTKSDQSFEKYWEFRLNKKLPLRYKTIDERDSYLSKMKKEYENNHIKEYFPTLEETIYLLDFKESNGVTEILNEALKNPDFSKFLGAPRIPATIELLNSLHNNEEFLALYNIENDIYTKYEILTSRKLGNHSRTDVKNRVFSLLTIFLELFDEEKDIKTLTTREFKNLCYSLISTKTHTTDGVTKTIRTLRVLTSHKNLEKYQKITENL